MANAIIANYVDRTCLVDVSVRSINGETDIETFDPLLLPSHCSHDFLLQLFHWANDNNVLPLSTYGTWLGKDGDAIVQDVLFLLYA